ncbi:CHSS2 synthase, partial [Polyodon spathula]|nr:CHSS2 synthase [Polyodon spathula]
MRLSMLISLIRPIGPVVIGISLGFTLSLLSVTWVEEPCSNPDWNRGDEVAFQLNGNPYSLPAGSVQNEENAEDFEPKIVPYKPVQQQPPPKKFYRALKSLVTKETLLQTKGTGASGSFKLNKKAAEAKEKAAKKKAAPKKPAAKKAVVKKTTKKVSAKKAATPKKTPTKAKKPKSVKKAPKSPKKAAAKPKKVVKKSPKKAKAAPKPKRVPKAAKPAAKKAAPKKK